MGRTVILDEQVNTARDIAGTSRNASNKRRLTQKTMWDLPTKGRSAIVWMAAAMLAMTWASETQASPDLMRPLADAQHATAARNLDSPGTAGDFEALQPSRGGNDKSVQVVQATTSDTGQSSEQEHHWAETLSCELTNARRDIELLQRLEQERDRADWLEQGLAAGRRDVETQTALTAKAVEETARVKQAAQGGAAELQNSLQRARERAELLERDLAAARRDVETQTALAAKAGEEASRPKQAGESGAAELQTPLQQERERSARLEQDLAAARRDVETQTALAAKASEEVLGRKLAAEAGAAELSQSRARADALAQDLSLTRSSIYAYEAQARKAGDEAAELRQAVANGAASLRKSAQDERERFARLEQDLAVARRDVETQAALAAKAGEEAFRLKQAGERGAAELQQERERSVRLEQDLAVVRRNVETQTALAANASGEVSRLKQVGESGAAELQRSLQQERERSARLEQDLAAMRRDVETQIALPAKAGEEASRRKKATEASAAELRQSMQKEHERADLLEYLSMMRSAIYAYEAQARKAGDEAAELRQAAANGAPLHRKPAQDERERSARLEQDLATARRDLETHAALTTKASEEAARARETAERDSAALRNSLQQERARTERLERDIALAQGTAPNVVTIGSTTRDKSIEVAANPIAERAPAASARGDAQPNSEQAAVATGLVARASVLLRQGDIGAARLVLERAVEMGSAQASFALAETYDPLILAKWGTYGTRGDASKAQDLYARADAAGFQEAKARLEALRR